VDESTVRLPRTFTIVATRLATSSLVAANADASVDFFECVGGEVVRERVRQDE